MTTNVQIGGQTYDQSALDLSSVSREFRGAWKMPTSGNVVEYDAALLKSLKIPLVQAERLRRLHLGFDYDFGDARGVHHIGTTEQDMEGWRDVIDYANALIDTGDTTTTINIVTDTGPASVTAPEWQAIMLFAAQIRQVLWARSFALQAMDPIPENFADDSHWT